MSFSLVIMAAGMGSRFGGLKQLTSFGPKGETLADYSIHDSLSAGCDHIVIIVREEIREQMKNHFGTWESTVNIEFVNQSIDDLPNEFQAGERSKPWGTVHAVWSARQHLRQPFVVLNADDYYGRESYEIASKWITSDEKIPALLGFTLGKTVSESGGVTRGLCITNESNELTDIVEQDDIVVNEQGQISCIRDGEKLNLNPETVVSMNMWVFQSDIISQLESEFITFLDEKGDAAKSEFHLPMAVQKMVHRGERVKVLSSPEQWFGVTFAADSKEVKSRLSTRAIF